MGPTIFAAVFWGVFLASVAFFGLTALGFGLLVWLSGERPKPAARAMVDQAEAILRGDE